jgi:DNA-binding Xre family transcriptional regulator
MIPLNRDLTNEEQAALFQAMTVEQLVALKGTPIKLNWSEEDLAEMAAFQDDEDDSPEFSVFQRMTFVEIDNFMLLKNMSMAEKIQKTGLSQIVIEIIENDATEAVYGDILKYCNRLGIPKELFLENLLEEQMA